MVKNCGDKLEESSRHGKNNILLTLGMEKSEKSSDAHNESEVGVCKGLVI